MITLYLVLALALVGAAGMVVAFACSVRRGQLDDLDTPPRRILLDE
jgi:cbb3-type cytochrome oxidase maturation protein